MKTLNDFAHSLLSRKFWLTVAAFITALANKQYALAVGSVAAFVAAEAHVDARQGR
jgi:hypothetical protein